MYKFTYAVATILAGIICYVIAKKRGIPHPSLWFVGGVLFHIIAIWALMSTAKYFNSRKKGASS